MRISVVIPVYEDRAEVRERVAELGDADELIVVDASRVEAVRCSDLPAGARLIRAPRASRALQQNAGAEAATGDGVLFLHADTRLPKAGVEAVRRALRDEGVVGGGFERYFDSPSKLLRWTCEQAGRRSRRLGWFLGDQAIFVRRASFLRAGGFAPLSAFEDYDLCRRLKRCGRMVCLRPPLVSSARRFSREGELVRTVKDLVLTGKYLVLGASRFRTIQNVEINVGQPPRTSC